MGEADAISSPIIQESKAGERRRENSGLRTGLYSPLWVTCRLQAVCKRKCLLPIVNRL
jgi:hypothetical protein